MAKKPKAKNTQRKPAARKAASKRKSPRRVSGVSLPAKQGQRPKRADVGPGRPPVEHQFRPGQSGNPAGPPPARTHLWRHFCEFEGLTEAEIATVQRDKTQSVSRRTAAKQALQLLRAKKLTGTTVLFTRAIWDRDEGRAVAHVVMESADVLTAEECEEIRQAMKAGGK